jgi:hypothetical protein
VAVREAVAAVEIEAAAVAAIAEAGTGIRTADHKHHPIKTGTRVPVLIF